MSKKEKGAEKEKALPEGKVREEVLEELNKIDNEVDVNAKDKYVAWCDFTTVWKEDENSQPESKQVKKGDILTAKNVPLVWLRQAVGQRYAISQKDLDTLSQDTLEKRGYTGIFN
jgi:hypothetical protein